MGAFETAYLKRKYGWSGEKLSELSGKIIQENQVKISEAVLNSDKRRLERNVTKLQPKGATKRIVLPPVANIIKRSSTIIKAADRGNLLTKTLRTDLRRALTNVMLDEGITTTKGTVRKSVAKKLEKEIASVFEGYTKKHPGQPMPSNIHTIAVTESRSAINAIREEYITAVDAKSPDGYQILKEWIHNDSLSSQPRLIHKRLHGVRKPLHEDFDVNGQRASRPHDPRLTAEQTIGCNCELAYQWVINMPVL